MSLSRINAGIDAYQAKDYITGFGQVRNGFRHLQQSIHNGHLENARQAYRNLSQTMPVVLDKVSLTLTRDYDEIGRALGEGNIAGARQAVVQLGRDLQDIGRSESVSPRPSTITDNLHFMAAQNYLLRSYRTSDLEKRSVGVYIDLIA